jgi:hypothetical protein
LGINETPFEFDLGEVAHVDAWSKEECTNGEETNLCHHFFIYSQDFGSVKILEILKLWHRKSLQEQESIESVCCIVF